MRQTVSFEEVIMSKDKYVQQMEAIVFIILHIFLSWKKRSQMIIYLLRMGCLLFCVVWHNFMSERTCPFLVTIDNHSLTRN